MAHLETGRDRVYRRLLAALISVVSLAFYLATLPRSVLPGDSGELIAASRTLSIAHPPGYPMYVMIGKLFSSLFVWGSVAYRYNLLSAVAVSATLAIVYLILTELRVGKLIALAVTLGLATLQSFWLQATTAEVYAFNALFTAILLHSALLGRRYGERSFLLIAFVAGLSLSHHLSLAYPVIAAVVILTAGVKVIPRVKTLVLSALLLIIGLTAWLYIPVRASLGPPLTWGSTDTLSGFLSHITAQSYRWRLRELAGAARITDFLGFFRVETNESGLILMLAALAGVAANVKRLTLVGGFVILVLLFAGHFAMYSIPDIESHVFPALIGIGVLAGLGLQALADLAARYRRSAGSIVAVCTFLVLIPNLRAVHPRRDEWFAIDYAEAIKESARAACGENCVVVTSGALSTFPLLYTSLTESGGVPVYDLAASNPSIIGENDRPANLEECVARAAEIFGRAKIALLGPVPGNLLGSEPRICGMVYVLDRPLTDRCSPLDYEIRGIGEDLREYSSRLLSATYYLHVARWHAQQGDTAAVRDKVERALAAAGDDVGTYVNSATLYLEAGMVRQAFGVAGDAVKVDPDFFEAHDLLANMLTSAGRAEEAVVEYRRALKGSPRPAVVYSNLANAYATMGDHANALDNFYRAIEIDSTLTNTYVGLGRTLEALGRTGEALKYLRHARSIDPNSTLATRAEATLLLKTGRPEEAIEVLKKGLAVEPNNAVLHSDMGLCHLRLDDLDRAIATLERALVLDPALIPARGNLAVAYERSGQPLKAIEAYRKYIELAPPGALKEKAREAIEHLRTGR
ncbi:MAG: tetratricopeptide repeat protein [Candidatus Eisenbacteria bacterium]